MFAVLIHRLVRLAAVPLAPSFISTKPLASGKVATWHSEPCAHPLVGCRLLMYLSSMCEG